MENIEEKKMITGYNFLVLMDFSESSYLALKYAITIAKTVVFTESHIFCEFTPKSSPKTPKSHLWVPFWAHLASRCRLFGELGTICGTPGGPLWI